VPLARSRRTRQRLTPRTREPAATRTPVGGDDDVEATGHQGRISCTNRPWAGTAHTRGESALWTGRSLPPTPSQRRTGARPRPARGEIDAPLQVAHRTRADSGPLGQRLLPQFAAHAMAPAELPEGDRLIHCGRTPCLGQKNPLKGSALLHTCGRDPTGVLRRHAIAGRSGR
jgi:hypothetical protein